MGKKPLSAAPSAPSHNKVGSLISNIVIVAFAAAIVVLAAASASLPPSADGLSQLSLRLSAQSTQAYCFSASSVAPAHYTAISPGPIDPTNNAKRLYRSDKPR
jgi:hypothetical protein